MGEVDGQDLVLMATQECLSDQMIFLSGKILPRLPLLYLLIAVSVTIKYCCLVYFIGTTLFNSLVALCFSE